MSCWSLLFGPLGVSTWGDLMDKVNIIDGIKIAKNGGKVLIDFSVPYWARDSKRYYPTEKIVYDKKSEIIAKGYRRSYGYKTDLPYYFIPVFVKFNNWKKCNYMDGYVDRYGRPCKSDDPGAYP